MGPFGGDLWGLGGIYGVGGGIYGVKSVPLHDPPHPAAWPDLSSQVGA